MYKIIRKTTGKIVDVTLDEFIKIIGEITIEAATDFLEKAYVDILKVYDQCIDQFYNKYETRKYSRHDVGVGTRTGMNLYRASEIKWDGSVLQVKIDSRDMAGYRPYKGKDGEMHPVDKGWVLDNVLSGIRGTPYDTGYGGSSMTWSAKDVGTKMFGTYSGTPIEILDQLLDDVEDEGANYIFNEISKILP